MSTPTLSIILPTYNECSWLPETLAIVCSELNQSGWTNAELIVVNDGSSDNTIAVLDSLNLSIPLKVLSHANSGRFYSRLVGLNASKSVFVLLIDSRVHVNEGSFKFLREQLELYPERRIWTGDVDIAKAKLKKSKYRDMEDHVLEENLSFIKESLGDKILNFFSKKLGGDVRKLDKILAAMKEEETRFVKDEHESESKFYKLSSGLAQLKRDKASQDEQNIIILKLTNLQKFIKDLVKSHNSIMDDLEKQVDIITKKNNRKADYYNLKRAHDSVETKKMRAEFKKKLIEESTNNL